ncbi:MAG: thiamine-phosphate kinase [Thermosynechococcaceae cyanobacterium]
MSSDSPISTLSEQQILQRIFRFCPGQWVGDDAAVVSTRPDHQLVVTSDMLVDGVHFSVGLAQPQMRTTSLTDVGWRSAAANLSDLAAMGATPLGITVSLGLPPTVPVGWVEELYEGMTECLNRYETPILGGDLCRSPILTLAITALGEVLPERQILRSTAQVGDAIVVTGLHGLSRAGLELLLHPEWGQDLSETERTELQRAHCRPIPRLDVPSLLWQIDPQVRVAGMDSSDGLADAVLQMGRASDVGAKIWYDRLPIPPALQKTTSLSEADALDWVLYGGEDFELVLCLDRAIAEKLVQQLAGTATVVGQVVADPFVCLADANGQPLGPPLSLERGFQHFGPEL